MPSRISAASFGFGTVSICAYQRSIVSTKASMSLSRWAATGCSLVSRSASATQVRARRPRDRSRAPCGPRRSAWRFPRVGLGLEMLAPVALDRHAPDQVPGHQLADRVRDVGAREPERVGDLLGGERPLRKVEQRVDLADRAVDPPLPPMSPQCRMKRSTGFGKFCGLFCYFCHNRNIGNCGTDVKGSLGK